MAVCIQALAQRTIAASNARIILPDLYTCIFIRVMGEMPTITGIPMACRDAHRLTDTHAHTSYEPTP